MLLWIEPKTNNQAVQDSIQTRCDLDNLPMEVAVRFFLVLLYFLDLIRKCYEIQHKERFIIRLLTSCTFSGV